MQKSKMSSTLSMVKLLQAVYAGDIIIGFLQIRLASVSLIPLAVGHILSACRGAVISVSLGSGAVSLPVMTPISDSLPLQAPMITINPHIPTLFYTRW